MAADHSTPPDTASTSDLTTPSEAPHSAPPPQAEQTRLTRALATIRTLQRRLAEAGGNQPIAIVGAGLRLPGGIRDLDGYWTALAEGRDLVRPLPESRKGPFAREWEGLPQRGGFLDEVLDFDADFFGISPREARHLDPQHRMLLEVTWEALENAALPADRLAGSRTGLYLGIMWQDYRDWLRGEPDAYWTTGNGHNFAAGRIAYALGLNGPALSVDTACSSSLVAVHLAVQALRRGECETAFAAGANLIMSPRSMRLVQETRSLSPDGLCRTFDARAAGFTRGEGCGAVVLKRLDHALRDGDRVHAVIRGSAVNQDGRSGGFTAPNVLAQVALTETALAAAGLEPADIGLVEAHGTGTPLGDPIEMEALATALGRRNGGAPLPVGAVKTNVGHLESAAGIAGLAKAVLCLRHRQVPPVVHFRTLNPRIDLSGTGMTVPTELLDWSPDSGRHAMVSSFGMSGTNAQVILGLPTDRERAEAPAAGPDVPVEAFEISARTPQALRDLAARYADRLTDLPAADYPAFAHTAGPGRARLDVRARIAARGPAEAAGALRALADGRDDPSVTVTETDAPGVEPVGADLPRRVVDLPAYPWQHRRHAPASADGPESTSGSAERAGQAAKPKSAPAAPAWAGPATEPALGTGRRGSRQGETPDPAAPTGPHRPTTTHHIAWYPHAFTSTGTSRAVLAGDDVDLLVRLAHRAAARGAGGTLLLPATPTPPSPPPGWRIRSLPGTAAEWHAHWSAHPEREPARLVLVPRPVLLPDDPDGADPVTAGADQCAAVTAAVAAAHQADGAPRTVFAVTTAARRTGPDDPVAAAGHGALHGLAAVLGLELSAAWGGIVDLPAEPSAADLDAALDFTDARTSAGATARTEDVAAVRAGRVLVARLRPAEAPGGELPVRPDGTYVVTGALGAVGRELVTDLVRRGARHLLLIGRRTEEELDPDAAAVLARLRAQTERTVYRGGGCDTPGALAEACAPLAGLPPVRGVIHAAGTVRRTPAARTGSAEFAAALRDKAAGAWWLHRVAADWAVDFFVLVSSVSAVWGTDQCAAYAAANGALDALAAHRVARGLPATSIAYGPWALDGRGMADGAAREQYARLGVGALDAEAGCAALTARAPGAAGYLVACPLDVDRFTHVMSGLRPRGLFAPDAATAPEPDAAQTTRTGGATSPERAPEPYIGAELAALPQAARPDVARGHVARILAGVLGHDDPAAVRRDTGFFDLGLDSIAAVDLVTRLAESFGVTLAVADVFDHPTVTRLATHLLTLPTTPAPTGTTPTGPTSPAANADTTAPAAPTGTTPTGPASPAANADTTAPAAPTGTTPTGPTSPAANADTTAPAAPTTSRLGVDPTPTSPDAPATPAEPPADAAGEPVAIVGMAGRFPGADSVEELWDLLREGRDGVGTVPPDRWDATAFRPGGISTDRGGFLRGIDRFDARFFDVPAREAENLDPQQRLLLESAWHALEHGGIDPTRLKGTRTGVFVGISYADYARLLARAGTDRIDAYYGTGTALNAAAGRLAYVLGLNGPALAVDTACSSSLVALHLAVRSLRSGESDTALAGGVNVLLDPTSSVSVSRAHMLSPDGRCRTFSADANGFVRSEGCGVVVLKRLADARRDGDRVLAVIRGSAVNQDGASSGLTVPSGTAQEAMLTTALADAGLTGGDVSYLEAHGTGTSLGDPVEVGAASRVLGPGRRPGEPLRIGSVKSNIGHCESAAGMAAVIKTVLALRHGLLPANLHFTRPNPHIDWATMNVQVVEAPTPWRRGARPRVAGVSGFGFTGTNAHVLLEEAPDTPEEAPDTPGERTPDGALRLLPLSAPDPEGLDRLTDRWRRHLEHAPDSEIPALAATAGTGRAHFPYRRILIGRDREQFLSALDAPAPTGPAATGPRIAFLFSGQGSQYAGMGRELHETEPVFRAAYDACDRALAPALGASLTDLVLYADDPQAVDETRVTQPALVALEVALTALWRSWGVTPALVMGHSVGEIAAALSAGVLTLDDGLTLIAERARLMQATERGAMLAVVAPEADAAAWAAAHGLDVAAVNGPTATVLSGVPAAVEELAARLTEHKVRHRRLSVSHAFHSRLLDPALDDLTAALAPLRFTAPDVPIVSNVTGRLADADTYDAAYWRRHARLPVRFHDGARQLALQGIDVCLEIGPDRTLVNLVRSADEAPPGGVVSSLRRSRGERDTMRTAAAQLYALGQDLDWARINGGRGTADAPRYPFAPTRHWTRAETTAGPAVAPGRPAAPAWGTELRSPALHGRVFATERSTGYPAHLTDHRLFGVVSVPGASQTATVLSALGRDGGPVALADLHFPRALVLREQERYDLQIIEAEQDHGTTTVSVQSLVDPDRGTWQEHLAARVADPADARPAPPPPAPRAFAATAEHHVTGADFYDHLRTLGYHLGPSFRWIRDVWIHGDEAIVRFAEPAEMNESPDGYRIHPGLLDSCLQSTVAFAVAAARPGTVTEETALAIPFAADRVLLRGRPARGGELWGQVRVERRGARSADFLHIHAADLRLFDADGAVVLTVDRFRFRRASRELLERSLREPVGHAHTLVTREFPLPAADFAEGRVIAVAGAEQPAVKTLAHALEQLGHRVRHVTDADPATGVDLVVDGRFLDVPTDPAALCSPTDTLDAVRTLARTLRGTAHDVPYAVLCAAPAAGRDPSAPLRAALWGMLASLEAEQTDRRLLRVTVAADGDAAGLARALTGALRAGIPETRLEVHATGVRVPRLVPYTEREPRRALDLSGTSALITGGLGALGLSTAAILADWGAAHVTLLGRSAPGESARRVLAALTARGVGVQVVQGDVTAPDDCRRAVAQAGRHAPLRTAFHLAGVTDDGAFAHLDEASFERVFTAKAAGAAQLAAALDGHDLDAFVLYSSVSAVLGSAGQTNYAAANGYLDGLAEALRAAGRPVTSVAWGPWTPDGHGGLAATDATARAIARLGIGPLSDEEAERLLRLAVTGGDAHLVAVRLDGAQYAARAGDHPRAALLGGAPQRARGSADRPGGPPPRGWLGERLAGADAGTVDEELRSAVRRLAGEALGEDAVHDDHTGFGDLGLDSIMVIDLRTRLAHALAAELPATVALDHPTVAELAAYAATFLGGAPDAPGRGAAYAPQGQAPQGAVHHDDADLADLSFDDLVRAVQADLTEEK
ncbi:SDR family NAD(P)-dependent oxidoreductase [Streptomyces sp. NPDC018693]|uniref:SDR family NAD(P)-dependent oxidoreductase n=1 Tax=unclassified Streptomyces TaxID=2593676 RepID=UPI003795B532